eukprot:225851_1
MSSAQESKNANKKLVIGISTGVVLSSAIYIGYRLWNRSFNQTYKRISKNEYSTNPKINDMLHVCATIIEMSSCGYLSTINSTESNKQYPCCRMIQINWKPIVTLPYLYIGSNRTSRKFKQIEMNNNIVITFGDIDGAGYVSCYGQLIEINDKQKTKSMFPPLWRLFLTGPNDERFVMFTLHIETIEFVSHRYNFDSLRNDWKPFIIKRLKNTLFTDKAEWEIVESPDIVLSK